MIKLIAIHFLFFIYCAISIVVLGLAMVLPLTKFKAMPIVPIIIKYVIAITFCS